MTRAGVRGATRSAAGAAQSPQPAPSCSAPACTDGGAIYFYTSNKIFSNSSCTCGCEVSTWLASRGRQCWVEESSCGSSLANQRGVLGHVIRCGDLIGCQLAHLATRCSRWPSSTAACTQSTVSPVTITCREYNFD